VAWGGNLEDDPAEGCPLIFRAAIDDKNDSRDMLIVTTCSHRLDFTPNLIDSVF
jgi:hypothetical protein